jgi:hypothetical protein
MVSATGAWSWSAAWVRAGLAAAVMLFASGGFLGFRHRQAGVALEQLRASGGDARELARDPVLATLPWVNTGIALAVVFVMTTKPALAGSAVSLAAGIAAGLVASRATARAGAPATEVAAG